MSPDFVPSPSRRPEWARVAAILAMLAAAFCAAGCAHDPPPALESCPASSEPWIEAGRAARSAEERETLVARASGLQDSCPGLWAPHWLEGDTAAKLGQADAAIAAFERAYGLARDSGDPAGVTLSANPLASLVRRRGELDRAESLYDEAIVAAQDAGRADLEAYAHANAAGLYVDRGDLARAVEHLSLAERGLASLGQDGQQRRLAYNRATLHLRLGDAERARAALETVHGSAAASDDASLADHAAVALGALHLVMERPERAAAWYARVTDADARVARRAQFGAGRVALSLGRPDEAIARLQEVVERAGEEDPILVQLAECFIAEAELAAGRVDEARARLTRVIAASDSLEAGRPRWIARWLLGRLELSAGNETPAARQLRTAVDLIDAHGAGLSRTDDGMRYLRERYEPYVDLARAQLARALDESALDVRVASALLDTMARSQARGLAEHAAERDRAISAHGLAEIQRGLEPGEWVVSYLLGNTAGVVLAISHERAFAREIAGRDVILPPLFTFRSALVEPRSSRSHTGALSGEPYDALHVLAREIFGPIETLLEDASRLYIVPDRELALVPFAALPVDDASGARDSGQTDASGGTHLGDRVEIALLPLVSAPPGRASVENGPVLLAGLPVRGNDGMSDLAWSAHEIERIADIWSAGPDAILTGERLTVRGLRDALLMPTRTLHVASHARASVRDPSRSGVFLSHGEMLGLDAIDALPIDRALVVLSACRTGEGEIVPGEGVIGLRWAFLASGADAVVSSLWSVDDAATSNLMIEFHERLRAGASPISALAGAGRHAKRLHGHPTYWAPFTIVVRPGPESAREGER